MRPATWLFILTALLFQQPGLSQSGTSGPAAAANQTGSPLERRITVELSRQRLDDALSIIANKGGFSFSYNSQILKRDSLVSMSARDRTVRQVLNQLLDQQYEYKETGNYVILRRVAIKLTTVTEKTPEQDNQYTISGYVVNSETGERIGNVSVYETKQLVSALTDAHGEFSLKLRSRYADAAISVSKYNFEDTSILLEPRMNTALVIAIVPVIDTQFVSVPNVYVLADSSYVAATPDTLPSAKPTVSVVEQTAAAKFLLSADQRIQRMNLRELLGESPVQLSLLPGTSTQGRLNGQVVHHFSLNVFGGYTGGVDGFEVGGLFNINRMNVRYVQVAGLFNLTGGSVQGVQVAGLNSLVMGSVRGLQLSGIANYVRGDVSGWQLAGISNMAGGTMNGLQIGGAFNYAHRLKGVQIGLVNIADTSDGYSIGLVNIVLKGYHKLTMSTNELIDANVAYKTGSRHLYSILQVGTNLSNRHGPLRENKLYSFGYGLGVEAGLSRWLSLNPELSAHYLYQGSWDYLNLLSKLTMNLNIKLGKRLALFGGPVFNVLYSDQDLAVEGYRYPAVSSGIHDFRTGLDQTRGWFGWNAGIAVF